MFRFIILIITILILFLSTLVQAKEDPFNDPLVIGCKKLANDYDIDLVTDINELNSMYSCLSTVRALSYSILISIDKCNVADLKDVTADLVEEMVKGMLRNSINILKKNHHMLNRFVGEAADQPIGVITATMMHLGSNVGIYISDMCYKNK